MRLDHVVVGVADPLSAVEMFRKEYGLGAVPGSLAVSGVGSWYIPLQPPQHIELVYLADDEKQSVSPWFQWLTSLDQAFVFLSWALCIEEATAIASRVGEPVIDSETTLVNARVKWRAVASSRDRGGLPFFVEYCEPLDRRIARWQTKYAEANHEVEPQLIQWVDVRGSESSLRAWIGEPLDVELRTHHGPSSLEGIGIEASAGEIALMMEDP